MTDRYVFSVIYEEPVMKAAVRTFVKRAFFGEREIKTWAAIAGVVIGCAMLFLWDEEALATGLFIGLFVTLFVLLVAAWRLHWRAMRMKLDNMNARRSTIRIGDEGVAIENDSGSGLMRWRSIKAVWPSEGAWLLILRSKQFIALPTAGAPPEALEFLMAHVGAA